MKDHSNPGAAKTNAKTFLHPPTRYSWIANLGSGGLAQGRYSFPISFAITPGSILGENGGRNILGDRRVPPAARSAHSAWGLAAGGEEIEYLLDDELGRLAHHEVANRRDPFEGQFRKVFG